MQPFCLIPTAQTKHNYRMNTIVVPDNALIDVTNDKANVYTKCIAQVHETLTQLE